MLKHTTAFGIAAAAITALAGGAVWAAPGGGTPPSSSTPATVVATIPGGGGNPGDEDSDASSDGCPPGGPPIWKQATDAQVEAARRAGELNDPDDLANEALMGGANLWSYCDTTTPGYRLWDYRESEGVSAVMVQDAVAEPEPQLHPDNGDIVVGFPVWVTLENGGEQDLQLPPAAGRFRAVPDLVVVHSGDGNDQLTCVDTRGGRNVRADLHPPSRPGAEPPSDACLYEYDRPSVSGNAGDDREFEFVLEVEYRIEWIPPGQSGWRLYTTPPAVQLNSAPEQVQVAELQAVADD